MMFNDTHQQHLMDRRLPEPEMRRLLERADHPQSKRARRDRARSNLHDKFVDILEEILNDAITATYCS